MSLTEVRTSIAFSTSINQTRRSLHNALHQGGYYDADITGCETAARPLTNCTVGTGRNCFPYISYLDFLRNKSTSSYESLQVTLTHRYSRGLYLLAGYTWGHAVDVAGATSNTAISFIPQNSLDYQAEKGNGDYDIRHRFTASATYDLPSRRAWGKCWKVGK